MAISVGDRIWQQAIDKFASEKLKIEVISCSMRMYDLYSYELRKFINITEKDMAKITFGIDEQITYDAESNSFLLIDYILSLLSEFTGKKRISLKERLSDAIRLAS